MESYRIRENNFVNVFIIVYEDYYTLQFEGESIKVI